MDIKVNFLKPDFQPENVIYFSKIRVKSYKERLFKICNIALHTAIKYQRFLENNGNNKQKYYYHWSSFVSEYFLCSINRFNAKDKKTNLLGYCQWSPMREFYPTIHLRYFSKKYEFVFWHELAHLILHSKKEINEYISYNLKELEADFFVYSLNFYLKDTEDKNSFNRLLEKLNKISRKEIRNYNIYYTFLKDFGNNNSNNFFKMDLIKKTFYNNDYIK